MAPKYKLIVQQIFVVVLIGQSPACEIAHLEDHVRAALYTFLKS